MNLVQVKDKFDEMLYRLFNTIYSPLKLLFSTDLIKTNKQFYNKHLGRKCAILGTGPSLITEDISKFINYDVIIGVNFLYKWSEFNKIHIQYYFLIDEDFYIKYKNETLNLIKSNSQTIFFLRDKAKYLLGKEVDRYQNIRYLCMNKIQYADRINIDMAGSMTAVFNVLLAAIQCSLYMGFKQIDLYGSDFNSFAMQRSVHCYDLSTHVNRSISLAEELKFYAMVAYHHYAIARYAKKNNVRIVNSTHGSLLDAYEKIN